MLISSGSLSTTMEFTGLVLSEAVSVWGLSISARESRDVLPAACTRSCGLSRSDSEGRDVLLVGGARSNAASAYSFRSGKLWSPIASDMLSDGFDSSNGSEASTVDDVSRFCDIRSATNTTLLQTLTFISTFSCVFPLSARRKNHLTLSVTLRFCSHKIVPVTA